MELEITEHIIRIVIMKPSGRVDAFNAPVLRARADELFASGATRFVLDLTGVPFLDSSGMAALVSILKRARQAGGDVKMVQPREEAALRILKLTKFDRVFEMAATPEQAIASF